MKKVIDLLTRSMIEMIIDSKTEIMINMGVDFPIQTGKTNPIIEISIIMTEIKTTLDIKMTILKRNTLEIATEIILETDLLFITNGEVLQIQEAKDTILVTIIRIGTMGSILRIRENGVIMIIEMENPMMIKENIPLKNENKL
jgi:hypothetical protein